VGILLGLLEGFLSEQVGVLEEGVEVAAVELPWAEGGVSIRIALPEQVGEQARGAVAACLATIGSAFAGAGEERVWR
jgi:hypothetical protein